MVYSESLAAVWQAFDVHMMEGREKGAVHMRSLTSAILSSFLPRSLLESRGAKVVLTVAGAAVTVLLVVMILRLLRPSAPSVPDDLGLQPLYATDENGARWVIEPTAAQPFARLQESRAAVGLPLTVRADVRRDRADQVSVGLVIEGRAGERYSPQVSKNGRRLPAPELTLVDEAGRAVFKGKFKYG
jgi:hypothetical protein